jgi:hypothetical protein
MLTSAEKFYREFCMLRPETLPANIHLEVIEDSLDYRIFEELHNHVLQMREAYVLGASAFAREPAALGELYRFQTHIINWFSPKVINREKEVMRIVSAPDSALMDLERWYQASLRDAVRNILLQREGGIMGALDKITEGFHKEKQEARFKLVFSQCIPVDQHAQLRLARELMQRYGQVFGKDSPDRKIPELIAANIEQEIRQFIRFMHAAKQHTTY